MLSLFLIQRRHCRFYSFFFNDTATTEIYTLSLHDALPISSEESSRRSGHTAAAWNEVPPDVVQETLSYSVTTIDRKSTRLNSSHLVISYAVFCLKKKKEE